MIMVPKHLLECPSAGFELAQRTPNFIRGRGKVTHVADARHFADTTSFLGYPPKKISKERPFWLPFEAAQKWIPSKRDKPLICSTVHMLRLVQDASLTSRQHRRCQHRRALRWRRGKYKSSLRHLVTVQMCLYIPRLHTPWANEPKRPADVHTPLYAPLIKWVGNPGSQGN